MKRAIVLVCLALTLSGCGAVLSALASVAPAVGLIGSAIDAADEGADAFFARHPSLAGKAEIDRGVKDARLALLAYNRAAAAASSVDSGDMAAAKAHILATWSALRALLSSWGVLTGVGPAGGADGAGGPVQPLDVPTVAEIDALL